MTSRGEKKPTQEDLDEQMNKYFEKNDPEWKAKQAEKNQKELDSAMDDYMAKKDQVPGDSSAEVPPASEANTGSAVTDGGVAESASVLT